MQIITNCYCSCQKVRVSSKLFLQQFTLSVKLFVVENTPSIGSIMQKSSLHRPIHLSVKFATMQTFRSLITQGCRVLHFLGRGNDQSLFFEDAFGLVHPIAYKTVIELFSAGGPALSTIRLVVLTFVASQHISKCWLFPL